MPTNIQGPGIFLAQFAGDQPPFNSLDAICGWAAGLGYKGVQIPSWDGRLFDLKKAAEFTRLLRRSQGHRRAARAHRSPSSRPISRASWWRCTRPMTRRSTPLRRQALHGKPKERQAWAVDQLMLAAKASRNLGLRRHVTFSGALAWPFVYPWPQRPPGLIETAFAELAGRWQPILDAFDANGVDVCYEIHPGEDIFDGASFELFLDRLNGHKRCCINYDPSHFVLMQLDYLAFIDIYHERIKAFHVKDAEFNPDGRQGVYSGYQPWLKRAGRFRSLGDGQVDFRRVFSQACGP